MTSIRPRALITGASSGIGRVFAEQLAHAGYDIVAVARREERLQALADRIKSDHGADVEVLPADLESPAGVAAVVSRIEEGGALDLVINNAGYGVRGRVAELDPDALESMIRVNVIALSRISRAAMGRMQRDGKGKIINVSSATVFMQMPGNAGYGSTKNYVLAFTRHMQVEAQGTGVQVQLLIPGLVDTEFHDVAGSDASSFPPERVMQADDLVAASLKALELGELVCIPSLPDVKDWEAYVAAEQRLLPNVSWNRPADRYSAS